VLDTYGSIARSPAFTPLVRTRTFVACEPDPQAASSRLPVPTRNERRDTADNSMGAGTVTLAHRRDPESGAA
jgi:hypothetical protein